jgi:hypothetical protein
VLLPSEVAAAVPPREAAFQRLRRGRASGANPRGARGGHSRRPTSRAWLLPPSPLSRALGPERLRRGPRAKSHHVPIAPVLMPPSRPHHQKIRRCAAPPNLASLRPACRESGVLRGAVRATSVTRRSRHRRRWCAGLPAREPAPPPRSPPGRGCHRHSARQHNLRPPPRS